MKLSFLKEFKIPTILGLSIIIAGIAAGVLLVLNSHPFISKASPDLQPKDITVSNISDDSVAISWQTDGETTGFISYGQISEDENTTIDDRDNSSAGKLQNYTMHYVTIKKLLPKTTYKFKVLSGKINSKTDTFTTASPISDPLVVKPIIGTAADTDGPLKEGLAFISIPNMITQSALIKNNGNFLIPLTFIRTKDLNSIFSLSDPVIATLSIVSKNNKSTVTFNLANREQKLPVIKMGQNVDLTVVTATPIPSANSPALSELDIYDLNGDGKINANDYAIALKNKGKKIKSLKANLNTDAIVDDNYLDKLKTTINQ